MVGKWFRDITSTLQNFINVNYTEELYRRALEDTNGPYISYFIQIISMSMNLRKVSLVFKIYYLKIINNM